jgi:hypothetical protein
MEKASSRFGDEEPAGVPIAGSGAGAELKRKVVSRPADEGSDCIATIISNSDVFVGWLVKISFGQRSGKEVQCRRRDEGTEPERNTATER